MVEEIAGLALFSYPAGSDILFLAPIKSGSQCPYLARLLKGDLPGGYAMCEPCTHPGCVHLAVNYSDGSCAEHFLGASYARVNECSRVLARGVLDSLAMSELKCTLYAIADKACVIAHTESLNKIDQIRILELEELVGKTLCSMRALARNQYSAFNEYATAESFRTIH
jgi:hypothetical protein